MILNPGEIMTVTTDWEQIFDAIPDYIAVIDYQQQSLRVNRAMAERLGCPPGYAKGCHCCEVMTEKFSFPDVCPKAEPFLKTDKLKEEIDVNEKDRNFEISATPIYNPGGTVTGTVHIIRDVTLQKNKEKLLTESLAIGEYALGHTAQELLTLAIDKAEALTGSSIGFFHFLDDDEQTISLQSWSTKTKEEYCTISAELKHYPIQSAGIWTECLYKKEPVIHNDYESYPNKHGLPEGHATVIRELTVPVIRRDKVVAIFGVGNKPVPYNRNDVENLVQLTNIAWEHIVSKQYEEALHKSESYARALLDAIPDLIFRMSRDGEYLDFKGPREELHYQAATIIGKNNREVTPKEFSDFIEKKIHKTIESGKMEVFEYQLYIEGRGLCDFEARMVPSGPDEITAISRDITTRKLTEESLKKKVDQLEWFNKMMIDRELKMIELKKEVNSLAVRLDEPERYVIHNK